MKALKIFLGVVALAACGLCHAAIVLNTPVVTGFPSGTAVTKAITVASNNDTIIIIVEEAVSAGTAPTSVTDSAGTVSVGVAWGGSGSASPRYTGMWYVAGATAGSHTITVNNSTIQTTAIILMDYSGLDPAAPFDNAATLNPTSTQSSSAATNSATPNTANDLAIAWWGAYNTTGVTSSAWTNSFTQEGNVNSGSTADSAVADLVLSGTPATSTTATLSGSYYWVTGLAFFKAASGGSSCTHDGWTSSGTKAVPTSGSTSVWLSTRAFGTVDCSTTNYWQIPGAVFGAN